MQPPVNPGQSILPDLLNLEPCIILFACNDIPVAFCVPMTALCTHRRQLYCTSFRSSFPGAESSFLPCMRFSPGSESPEVSWQVKEAIS
jgi:hypothetical protein